MKRRLPDWLVVAALVLSSFVAHGQPERHERWINASGVNVRSEPSMSAAIIDRLPLNAKVDRVDPAAAFGAYCELRWTRADGVSMRGFAACRYLAEAPADVRRLGLAILPDGTRNPGYDPARLFWLAPSWAGLEAYATQLNETQLPNITEDRASFRVRETFPRNRDEELERMKAHLAQGIHGAAVPGLVAWDDVRQQALFLAAARPDDAAADLMWHRLGETLGLWASFENQYQNPAIGARLAAGMVQAVALPTASQSLFKQPSDIAALGDDTAHLSGRFGIVHTYRTQPRRHLPDLSWIPDGWWDIGAVTTALTRPIVRTTLFRDGRMQRVTTHASRTESTWGTTDRLMCQGWVPGFAHGDADARLWASDPDRAALRVHAPQSLVILHTRRPLPASTAPPVVQTIRLDRAATGFVRATQMHFDLDGDGHPDLVAWEGVGRGPGHLDGETKTDDAWYRLFFVNLAGRWHVLGADSFAYGCGC